MLLISVSDRGGDDDRAPAVVVPRRTRESPDRWRYELRTGPVDRRPRVVIISASVGAGHDGAAAELEQRLGRLGCAAYRYDGLSLLPHMVGSALRRSYLTQVRWAPRTWGPLLAASTRPGVTMTVVHRVLDRAARRVLEVVDESADVVVSTYPLVSQALGRLRERGALTIPTVTYLTDPWVHPLWLHAGIDHVIARGDLAREQQPLFGRGGSSTVVHWCAPVVATRFTTSVDPRRVEEMRASVGIRKDVPAVLVTAGSEGAGDVTATARDLSRAGAFPVVLCGRNGSLRRSLQRRGLGAALGWTDDVPTLLAACDGVVQNAGGLACHEAVAAGRRVASYRVLPGHGAINAQVLDSAGIVPWLRSPRDLRAWLAGLPDAAATVPTPAAGSDPATVIASCAHQRMLDRTPSAS